MGRGTITATVARLLFPDSRRGRKERLRLGHLKAIDLYADGYYDQSKARIAENIRLAEKLGETSFDLAEYLDQAADFLHNTGNYGLAEEPARRALQVRETLFGPDDTALAGALNNLGLLLYAQGRDEEAVVHFARLESILETHSPGTRELAVCRDNLAASLRRLHKTDEAAAASARAKEIWETFR